MKKFMKLFKLFHRQNRQDEELIKNDTVEETDSDNAEWNFPLEVSAYY